MNHAWKSVLVVGCFAATSCEPAKPAAKPSAAQVEVAKQGDLLVVTLSPAAEQRLGITTSKVERVTMSRPRPLAGEVQLPPGRAVVLTAPLAGTISGSPPPVGTSLAAGQTLLTLTPLLSAESRASLAATHADAEGALAAAAVQLDASDVALARAERLVRDDVGTQRAVDEARAAHDVAGAAVKAARERRDLLAGMLAGTAGSLPITAPFAGMLRQLHVAAGQLVGSGAALGEVADLSEMWVRVAVYVGDLADIDTAAEVQAAGFVARPTTAPPAGNAAAATVDLVYAVRDQAGSLRPGQRVLMPLPTRRSEPRLGVPWAAIHRDAYGGTWLYESLGDRRFVRRRVEVPFVDRGIAAIDGAIEAGTAVVTAGVPELYGIEFGHAR